jgi:hypothetical protein
MGAAPTLADRRTAVRKTPYAPFPVALQDLATGGRLSAVLTDVSCHGLCLRLRSRSQLRPGDEVELLTLGGTVALRVAWAEPAATTGLGPACGLLCTEAQRDLSRMLSFFCD